MIRNLAIFIFVSGVIYPGAIFACSCGNMSDEQLTALSDFVFEGTVTDSENESGGMQVSYTFGNLLIVKGEQRDTINVVTAAMESACGVSFVKNVKYRVYAEEHNGRLSTGLCSSSRVLPFKWNDLKNKAATRSAYLIKHNPYVLIETKKLIDAGCTLINQGSSINGCFSGDKKDAYYCDGSFSSSFTAKDGSLDQLDVSFRWHTQIYEGGVDGGDTVENTLSDEYAGDIEITHIGAAIYADECINGMDSTLRWERARTLSTDPITGTNKRSKK